MYQYHILIPVTKEEVEAIKREFAHYLEESGGFAIEIAPIDPDGPVPSDELQAAISGMYTRLIAAITFGRFEGVN